MASNISRQDIQDDIFMIMAEADAISSSCDEKFKHEDAYIDLMKSFDSLISSLHKFKDKFPE